MSPETKPKVIGLVVVALLVIGGTGTVVWMNRQESTPESATSSSSESLTPASPSSPPPSDQANTDETYKNGTYSAEGTYRSPGGNEKIGVTVTLVDNVVSDVAVQTFGSDSTAADYQSQFKDGIREIVVGKKINDISVSRVSGSSLTSTGFNNALETIKTRAES